MLEKFLIVTHAITLPDLEEYNWRSNKVSDFAFVFFDFANMQHVDYHYCTPFLYCHDAIICVHASWHLGSGQGRVKQLVLMLRITLMASAVR